MGQSLEVLWCAVNGVGVGVSGYRKCWVYFRPSELTGPKIGRRSVRSPAGHLALPESRLGSDSLGKE